MAEGSALGGIEEEAIKLTKILKHSQNIMIC
jgi:hypothetical protein